MPHIVIIDSDYFDRTHLVSKLKENLASPTLQITTFSCMGHFLLALDSLGQVDLIITEKYLALCGVGRYIEQHLADLHSQFPKVTVKWKAREGSDRLLKYLQEKDLKIPVIIYANVDKESFDPSTFNERVRYCRKYFRYNNLLTIVREMLLLTKT